MSKPKSLFKWRHFLPQIIIIGTITAIDFEEQEVIVQFADREVSYDYADLDEVTLAWVVTVHKAHLSEYPVVILPVFMQHYMMLSWNLLYMGLTRALEVGSFGGTQKGALSCYSAS